MIYRRPQEEELGIYTDLVKFPLQSVPWGTFRQQQGIGVERLLGFEESTATSGLQIFFHPVPHVPYKIGYVARGAYPDEIMLKAVAELGQMHKAIFIKWEPHVSSPPFDVDQLIGMREKLLAKGLRLGKANFANHTFVIDLTLGEETLLAQMKSKTRYNVQLATKRGVSVIEDSTDEGFEDYLKLLAETTSRQQFYAHTEEYQRAMWKHLRGAGIAHLLKAVYQDQVLSAWILFSFNGVLYYPYGASSREYREVMANNLMMWEAIKFGKTLGASEFDLWGCLGPKPDNHHPWFGFHTFKAGFGGTMREYVGSYDQVLQPHLYAWYLKLEQLRWKWLQIKRKIGL